VFKEDESLNKINMNEIVGQYDVLFICLDALRYDVAIKEEEDNNTPCLNQYGKWKKCNAPGNFTYPSHHAMFAGFLPSEVHNKNIFEREFLFFPKNIGLGAKPPKNAFAFEGSTFIEGLENVGYETICIGGVAFFNKRSAIGRVFPNMFKQSHWNPSFSCSVKGSVDNQIDFAIKKLINTEDDKRMFMYLNIDAIHYPNYFYLEGAKTDNLDTHAAALRYVDSKLPKLFKQFKDRNKTFVIVCSDHGTCYGEEGYTFHGFNNEIINTVPYKHFVL
jgi:hypothetical protein